MLSTRKILKFPLVISICETGRCSIRHEFCSLRMISSFKTNNRARVARSSFSFTVFRSLLSSFSVLCIPFVVSRFLFSVFRFPFLVPRPSLSYTRSCIKQSRCIKWSRCIKRSFVEVPKTPLINIILTSIRRSWSLFTESQRPVY